MKNSKSHLKQKAENILRQRGVVDQELYSKNLEELIEELQIYQIELEFQNDELLRIRHLQDEVNKKYEDLYNNSPYGYITITQDLKIIELNTSFERLVHDTKVNLKGSKVTKFIAPKSQDDFYRYINEVFETEEDGSTHLWIQPLEGKNKFCLIESKFVLNGVENQPNILLAIIDISKEKDYEIQLEKEKQFWVSTFELASDGIMVLDEEQYIIQCNKRVSEILHKEKTEMLGENFNKIVWSNTKVKPKCAVNQSISSRKLHSVRYYLDWLDIHVNISSNPILNNEGMIALIVVNITDITSQIAYENQLNQAIKKAEESDRLKSAFLANMSHEIRTPINAIVGFSKLLRERSDIDSDTRDKYTDIISERSNDLLRIINDIIDISKIEAGQLTIHNQVFDVKDVLNNLYFFYQKLFERMNPKVKLKLEIDKNMPRLIKSDETRFKQILTNLLENAIRFTENGFIRIGAGVSQNDLEFFVQDTGIGIESEYHSIIFERFRQSDSLNTPKKGGNGLGLAISRSLIENMNGKMKLESSPGEGSKFIFTLPNEVIVDSQTQIEPSVKEDSARMDNNHRIKVLMVEDDEFSSLLLKEMLKSYQFEIYHTTSGLEAVDLTRKIVPDLILMDMKVDDLDGLNATKRIREFNPTVPIFAQTAYAMQSDREKFLNAGCNEFLTKPLDKSTLIYSMVKHLPVLKTRS